MFSAIFDQWQDMATDLEVSRDDFVLSHGSRAHIIASRQVKQKDEDQTSCYHDAGQAQRCFTY